MTDTEKIEAEGKRVFLTGVATLATAFLIGTFVMIYNNDKNSQIFVKELSFLTSQVSDLKDQIKEMRMAVNKNTLDRWTRSDHTQYDRAIQKRLQDIEKRVFILEQRNHK
jgi:hypothetical protein